MKLRVGQGFGLLLLGAGPRLAVALLILGLLWAGFFWATTSPGAL
ncbi:MAG: hypothetical protein AAFQ88_01930 [Pseudomonadota bacterium]